MAKKPAEKVTLLSRTVLFSCCVFATLCPCAAAAAPVCTPPTLPFLPESDATLTEYADLLSQDFEQYFSEMTAYSSCLDHARADLLVEAQGVSRLYREFLARVESLGLARKAATDPNGPTSAPLQDGGIAEGHRDEYQ